MAKYCAASGCQTKSKQGITLHRFPPDPQQRLEWTEFVRRSGRGNSWTPRPQSLLCSLHFAPSCYVRNLTCLSQYSPQALRILDHGALPTISASPCCTTAESEATSSKQRRLEASTSADSLSARSETSENVQYSTSYEVATASCSTSSGADVSLGAAACTPVHVPSGRFDAKTHATATQATLKPHTRSIRVQATCATREVGTDAYEKLRSIVSTKRLLDDIRQVSPNFQTFGVESFHAVINRFAPKALSFSRAGMEARCTLAALHYNENAGNAQAVTKAGELRWQVNTPKARTGECTLAPIKVAPTYNYVARLRDAVDGILVTGPPPPDDVLADESSTSASALLGEPVEEQPPLPTTAELKKALVAARMSRYGAT